MRTFFCIFVLFCFVCLFVFCVFVLFCFVFCFVLFFVFVLFCFVLFFVFLLSLEYVWVYQNGNAPAPCTPKNASSKGTVCSHRSQLLRPPPMISSYTYVLQSKILNNNEAVSSITLQPIRFTVRRETQICQCFAVSYQVFHPYVKLANIKKKQKTKKKTFKKKKKTRKNKAIKHIGLLKSKCHYVWVNVTLVAWLITI